MTRKATAAKRANWHTPVSELGSPGLECVNFSSGLTISLSFLNTGTETPAGFPRSASYMLIWRRHAAFRVIEEEQYLPWSLPEDGRPTGATNLVENSDWIAELRYGNDYLDLLYPGAKHFVIVTDDHWVEVISNEEPEFLMIRG